MEQSTSSATASVDPDRVTLKYFENGCSNEPQQKVSMNADSEEVDPNCVTFTFRDENHTLGNILRQIIMTNPNVDFCGYSIPHPSESKLNLRIQTKGNVPAFQVLLKALDDVIQMSEFTLDLFDQQIAAGAYPVESDIQ